MKKLLTCLILMTFVTSVAGAQSATDEPNPPSFFEGVKATMQKYLGRPYVWGASGIKNFDCSGFVWRVLYENGVLMKRTTARKLYMMLPPVAKEEEWKFGTLIFFDDLTHVGIVDSSQGFYHAQVIYGTQRSEITPFWRRKIYGFRRLPTAP